MEVRRPGDGGRASFLADEQDMLKMGQRLPDAGHLALIAVSYTHLRAHETVLDLVCRLLIAKKKNNKQKKKKKEKAREVEHAVLDAMQNSDKPHSDTRLHYAHKLK